MSERYVLGSGRAPDWLKERMMLYLRPDGSVGYEIFGRYRNWTAQKGDTVTRTESGDVRVTSSTTPRCGAVPLPHAPAAPGDGKEGLDESKEGGYLE